jgi:hypothetical protein
VFDLLAVIISMMFMAYPDFFLQFSNEINYSSLSDADDRNTTVTAGHTNTTVWLGNCAGNYFLFNIVVSYNL